MRKLASVQKVLEVTPIPNADKIEEIKVMGWHCVAKKGEFKVGDSVVYCEIDTILPVTNPEFAFLEGKPIKTKKLRGIYSQGIAFPLSVLPNGVYKLNDDVSQVLGAKKWEPDDYNRQGGTGARFPSWIPKSDETRIAVLQDYLTRYKGTKCVVTEKLDGSSLTAFLDDDKELHVCSRNYEITDHTNFMYKTAEERGFKEKLLHFPIGTVVQGEIIGAGIQKDKYKLPKKNIFIYNLREENRFPDNELVARDKLKKAGFDLVPLLSDNFELIDDIDKLTEMSVGKSKLYNTEREGIVIRPIKRIDVLDSDGYFVDGRFSVKAISPKFLVKNGL